MKFLLILLLPLSCFAQQFRSDSTLMEVRDPVYHQGRQIIVQPFQRVRDSIFNSQPNWRDSVKSTISKDTVHNLELRPIYHNFKSKWDAEREVMRVMWCPYATKLKAYNLKWHVVGDMRAQCDLKTE